MNKHINKLSIDQQIVIAMLLHPKIVGKLQKNIPFPQTIKLWIKELNVQNVSLWSQVLQRIMAASVWGIVVYM